MPDHPVWWPARDGDPDALRLMARHYTWRRRRCTGQGRLILGPGEKMLLLTADGLALFGWRKFIDHCSTARDVCCSVFRNEGPQLASTLILAAEEHAWHRWPGAVLYTHVNPALVRSVNPGCCFRHAGWSPIGTTGRGLITFAKAPQEHR